MGEERRSLKELLGSQQCQTQHHTTHHHTRDNKTLDLFDANTKEAYHSLPLPPLGRADHNLVHLQPVYKPLVQRQPAVTRTVKKWSEEAQEALKDCFNTILWDVFSDTHGEDIDNLTNCITDYINFCVENTVPTRTVRSFPNSKPWITPDIKALLKEKKRAFVSGDKEELKTVQRELRRKIRQEKDNYRRQMENQLQELNSYRPVALTSHLMKTLERLILAHLHPLVSSFMDSLQFAYQPSIGVDDAVIYLLHTSLTHLEKAGSTVRIMFFDFSSAFNTIQPRLLGDKLEVAGVDHHLTTWILDYLTQRPQFVRVKGSESSDDSAAVGLITDGDDTEYRGLIQDFVDWSLRNNLQINAGKTKELVVDFRRRNNPPPAAVNILGTDVDVVESYKYLGVHLNNNLDWTHNTDTLVKKGNSRLFLLRRLRSFGVQGPLLRTFYDSVVGSAIFYGFVCWSSSITDRDRKRMDRLVRRASSVLGCPLDSVEVVGNGRMMAKLSSMLNNMSHPLQDTLTALGSSFSERLLHPRCVKERYRRSFLLAAVRLHNKHNTR
ncbi:hypothetical protein D4764_0013870 [Takifugu flavidus]|uniref:Reverse transcriptase domain-containing protein n=1 Tax=Takifugu flavidus TaxID=433684 RepID=A0A5C6MIZ8_9TELE|nr:hypothetical protein D4764_0013870 [Takifugu flavidus]